MKNNLIVYCFFGFFGFIYLAFVLKYLSKKYYYQLLFLTLLKSGKMHILYEYAFGGIMGLIVTNVKYKISDTTYMRLTIELREIIFHGENEDNYIYLRMDNDQVIKEHGKITGWFHWQYLRHLQKLQQEWML